jgi:pimeloyl-ACP methyl ester carboxylesterase
MGADTRYWDYGPSDATTTIVAVHGFRGEHHGLEPVIGHLDGIRIVSPDLPGFGESTALGIGIHDIAGYAAWLTAFMEALGLSGSSVILGHSFGSIIVAAAVADGLAAQRVILINPIASPAFKGPNALMSRLTLLYYRAARALPQRLGTALIGSRLIVRFMSEFLATSKDPALRRWIHDQHRTYFSRYATRKTLLEGFEASISTDVSMFAARVTAPTLLIAAEHDQINAIETEHRLESLFPDARLVVLADVGHLVHYERPREAAEQIIAFLGTGRLVDGRPA